MTLRWRGDQRYRAFVDLKAGVFSIVSDLLVDQAEGRTFGERLLLVWDPEETFTDLEFHSPWEPLAAEEIPALAVPPGGDVLTNLRPVESVHWAWHAASGTALLTLEQPEPLTWSRVGASGLSLAVGPEGYLARLCFTGAEDDPAGKAEGAWLEEVEAWNAAHLREG